MYPLISKWTMLSGMESQAILALQELAIKVKEAEPNTWMYTVNTPNWTAQNLPTPSQGQVVFIEVYKDEQSFQDHVNGPVFQDFLANYSDLFLKSKGEPYVTLEILQRKAGFIREELK